MQFSKAFFLLLIASGFLFLLSACSGTRAAEKMTGKAQLAVKQYQWDKADRYFQKALEKDPEHLPTYREYIGFLLKMDRRADALQWIDAYLELEPEPDARYFALRGDLLLQLEEHEAAIDAYQQFLDAPGEYDQLIEQSQKQKALAEQHLYDREHPSARDIRPLPTAINSASEEYLPLMPADGSFMIFTRRTRGNEDFYISRRQEKGWEKARPIPALNTAGNEGAATLSADGKILIFTRCQAKDSYGQCDLYLSTKKAGGWTPPRNMGPKINTRNNETQPALSPDGSSLYFASNRSGGAGKMDIWRVDWSAEDGWAKAVPLDSTINSPHNEKTPFIHYDNQTLYFTSDRPGGYGRSDLYLSRKESNQWQAAQNMRWPINTRAAEGTIYVAIDGTTGYMGRRETSGEDYDIYIFKLDTEVAAQASTYVKGRAIDAHTEEGLPAQIEVYDGSGERQIADLQSDSSGYFLVALPKDGDYQVFTDAPGYTFQSERYTYEELAVRHPDTPWLVELQAVGAEKTQESRAPIVLRNLMFRTGTADWLPQSETELQRLLELLRNQAELKIEIRGHTDDVGSAQANQILSMQRAKAVRDYLVERGISADRLSYEGYGESQPLVPNDSPEQRQINRRTEFIILDE